MKIKIVFLLGGLIVSLLLLEFFLRIGGGTILLLKEINEQEDKFEIKNYFKNHSYERYATTEDKQLIVTIGDSFTNGGNVESGGSYPYFLKKKLESQKINYSVLNMGMCEDSTFNTQIRLRKILQENLHNGVKYAVVLVGAADYFEPFRYNFRSDESPKVWGMYNYRPWYYSLRIYKGYRYIRDGLVSRFLGRGVIINKSTRDLRVSLDELTEKIKGMKSVDLSVSKKIFDELPAEFKEYVTSMEIGVKNPKYLAQAIVVYMMKTFNLEKKHEESIKLGLWLMEEIPEVVWQEEFDEFHYFFIQSFQFQSTITPKMVAEKLEKISKVRTKLINNKIFSELYKFFVEFDGQHSLIEQKRIEAWELMIKDAKEFGVQLIAMTYPAQYVAANKTIRSVAEKSNLMLIDLESYFKEMERTKEVKRFFVDDDHLTEEGYRVLAQKVFDEITRVDNNGGTRPGSSF